MSNHTSIDCYYTELSSEQKKIIRGYASWMEILGNLPVGVTGILLNCITVIVFSTPTMRNNFFNRLLMTLAVCDNIYLSCEILDVLRHRHHSFGLQNAFVYFLYPLRSVFMLSSILMTVALSMERYMAVVHPAEHYGRCTGDVRRRHFYYVFSVLSFSLIYNLPKFFDFRVNTVERCVVVNMTTNVNITNYNNSLASQQQCVTMYVLIATKIRFNYFYVLWYINILNFIFTIILPGSVLIYLNSKIYSSWNSFCQRQPSFRRRDTHSIPSNDQITSHPHPIAERKRFILFSIVIVFMMSHVLRVILNIDELMNITKYREEHQKGCYGVKMWIQICLPLNQLSIMFNSSTNFFIYVIFDPGFQKVLKQMYENVTELIQGVLRHRQVLDFRSRPNNQVNNNEEIELNNIIPAEI